MRNLSFSIGSCVVTSCLGSVRLAGEGGQRLFCATMGSGGDLSEQVRRRLFRHSIVADGAGKLPAKGIRHSVLGPITFTANAS